MKQSNKYLLILLGITLLSSCSVLKKDFCLPNMADVHVYSGNITSQYQFVPNPSFNFDIKDNAMGLIDSTTNCEPNALYDYNNYVYIFADNELPPIRDLKLFTKLRRSIWTALPPYELKDDAEIRVFPREFTVHIREKDQYEIWEATVNGKKVYKYWDKYYIEDYKNFLRYHESLRKPFTGEKLDDLIRNVAGNGYIRRVGSSQLPIFTSDRIDYTTGLITAPGTTDKIYYEKPNQAINYRLRHIYYSKEERSLIDSFYVNGRVKDDYLRIMVDEQGLLLGEPNPMENPEQQREIKRTYMGEKPNETNPLFVELNKINNTHLEKLIEGYVQCDQTARKGGSKSFKKAFSINAAGGIDSPPLPLVGNGN